MRIPDGLRIAYWVVAGALTSAGFYVVFLGELSPLLLLPGAAMLIAGWFALGAGRAWTILLGPVAALALAWLLNATVGL
jgi:hypothetical protein